MPAEDRDLRHDRQLDHDREEEERPGLRNVGGHHGACGFRFFVINAVTASSDEKSTNGWIWICLNGAVSLWPTLTTYPIGMLAGKSDGYCFERVPAVTMTSPSVTSLSLVTRSTISDPWPSPWRTTPNAPVSWSRACTALLSSVSSVTSAALPDTCVTLPTRPSLVTTGVSWWMPALRPAAITTRSSNSLRHPMMRVLTAV